MADGSVAPISAQGLAMRTASRIARIAGTILLLACLSMAAGAPAAHADYDAGKQALAAGQPGKAAAQWRAAAEAGDARSMLAPLSAVGVYMRKLDPAFDPRSFGHKSLSALIKSRPKSFRTRTEERKDGASAISVKAIG